MFAGMQFHLCQQLSHGVRCWGAETGNTAGCRLCTLLAWPGLALLPLAVFSSPRLNLSHSCFIPFWPNGKLAPTC